MPEAATRNHLYTAMTQTSGSVHLNVQLFLATEENFLIFIQGSTRNQNNTTADDFLGCCTSNRFLLEKKKSFKNNAVFRKKKFKPKDQRLNTHLFIVRCQVTKRSCRQRQERSISSTQIHTLSAKVSKYQVFAKSVNNLLLPAQNWNMENRKKAFFSFLTALNCRGNCSFGQILKWMLLIKNFVDKKQCAQATYYERLI